MNPFGIGGFDNLLFFVLKVQKEFLFLLIGWECVLPFHEYVITFLLFTEQEGVFAWEGWGSNGCFYLVIDEFMPGPLSFARAVPELYGVSVVVA